MTQNLKEKIITFDESALKDICQLLGVPYEKDIIGFTKYGVIKKSKLKKRNMKQSRIY